MTGSIWTTLGLTPQAGERDIRRAYARLLKTTRPDDDPVAFQTLRKAYEAALALAASRAAQAHGDAHGDDEPDREAPRQRARSDAFPPSAEAVETSEAPTRRQASSDPSRDRQDRSTRADTPPAPPPSDAPDPAHVPRVMRTPSREAQAAWQHFIGLHRGPESERLAFETFMRDARLTNLAVRDAFERICAVYCADDDADPHLLRDIAVAFDWASDPAYLLREQPQIARILLAKLDADTVRDALQRLDPAMQRLFKRPPPPRWRAQGRLMRPFFASKVGRALGFASKHAEPALEQHFNLASITFWFAQWQSRYRFVYDLTALLFGMWLVALIIGIDTAFDPQQRALRDAALAGYAVLLIAAVGVSRLAWAAWPGRWRRGFRSLRTHAAFSYGWIGLWMLSGTLVLTQHAHRSPHIQWLALCGVFASAIWALVAVPRTLEPWIFLFAPTLAALFGAQPLYAEVYGTRSFYWSLLLGPLASAFLIVQPALAARIRATRVGLPITLVSLLALTGCGGWSFAVYGWDRTFSAAAPVLMPLTVGLALLCGPIWHSDRSVKWRGLKGAVTLVTLSAFASTFLVGWILLAYGTVIRRVLNRKNEAADAMSARATFDVSALKPYRVGRYAQVGTFKLLYVTACFLYVALMLLIASVALNGIDSLRSGAVPSSAAALAPSNGTPSALRRWQKTPTGAPEMGATPPHAMADAKGPHLSCDVVAPTYPALSLRRGEKGRVVVSMTVGTDGKVERAHIKTSSGFKALDDAALDAVRRTTCAPFKDKGVAVKVKTERPFLFSSAPP